MSQADVVATKRVGFNDLCTSLQVFAVDTPNQVGLGEIQFVIAAVDEDALGIQQSTHGTITEDGRFLQPGKEITRHTHENTAVIIILQRLSLKGSEHNLVQPL